MLQPKPPHYTNSTNTEIHTRGRTRAQSGGLVALPDRRDVVGQRVVGVRRTQQRLDRQQDRRHLQRGAPLVCKRSVGAAACEDAVGCG